MSEAEFGGHNTPFPVHGLKRLKKDRARTNPANRMVSQAAWLNLRAGKRGLNSKKGKK